MKFLVWIPNCRTHHQVLHCVYPSYLQLFEAPLKCRCGVSSTELLLGYRVTLPMFFYSVGSLEFPCWSAIERFKRERSLKPRNAEARIEVYVGIMICIRKKGNNAKSVLIPYPACHRCSNVELQNGSAGARDEVDTSVGSQAVNIVSVN